MPWERAKSDRSYCIECERHIPKGALRLNAGHGIRQVNICKRCGYDGLEDFLSSVEERHRLFRMRRKPGKRIEVNEELIKS